MRLRLIAWSVAGAAALMAIGTQAASASNVIRGRGAPPPRVNRLGPPRFTALPLKGVSASALAAEVAAGQTVKVWSSSIASGLGGTYQYSMVGKNPMVQHKNASTNVTADVIPVKLKFKDSGSVFNPSKGDGCMNGSGSADSLLLGSSIYKKHSYTVAGKNIGDVQYLDGFQREEFAKYILKNGAVNPGYHVNLSPVNNEPTVSLTVDPSAGETVTGPFCSKKAGLLDINAWDGYLQNTLLPQLQSSGEIKPNQFPVFLFYNVLMYDGNPNNCCIIGYHSAAQTAGGGIQTYSTSDYVSKGLFTNKALTDIYAASHEVGEWMDDPFVNNGTPAWGNIGQVSGCQNNLEVGDPLTGTPAIKVTMGNGVNYHNQELAFRDWFYRTPSVGFHGWFSSRGTFTSDAGSACS